MSNHRRFGTRLLSHDVNNCDPERLRPACRCGKLPVNIAANAPEHSVDKTGKERQMADGLQYRIDENHVATITLDRPQRLNAVDHEVAHAMMDAVNQACADGARALILTGTGRFFSSGGDLSTGLDYDDIGKPMEEIWNPLVDRLMDIPMPVIAAMNGPAIGIGCAFALVADIIIADPSAYFQFTFANLGLIPDGGGSWLLAKTVGRHRALALILLADRLPASEARDWGIVHRIAPEGEALSTAHELALRFAGGPTRAYDLIRRSMRAALERGFSDSLAEERVLQSEAGRTRDFAEAIAAFAEKRPPRYVGA